jgi:subtilisin family serine protease
MQTQLWSKQAAPAGTETNTTWGLNRISHRKLSGSDYVFDNSAGEGSCAYIIDTGLNVKHPEFEGRATLVANYDKIDGTDLDMFGHGTHVAGTIGSKSYGVAKKVKLFGVKACNMFGGCEVSNVIKGIQTVLTDSKTRDCPKGVVINISLGSSDKEWQSVRDVTQEAADAGVFIAVSAGNSFTDAKKFNPASAPGVCTVGATDDKDVMAVFSNYGQPVAVFAPGVDILSTYSVNGSIETVSHNLTHIQDDERLTLIHSIRCLEHPWLALTLLVLVLTCSPKTAKSLRQICAKRSKHCPLRTSLPPFRRILIP